jgi:transketolase
MALEAAEMLKNEGIDAAVIDIATIKPIDEELLVKYAKKTGKIVTCEEHSIIGGLGGAVCEAITEKCPVPVKRIGIRDIFGESGPALELYKKYGLDAQGIYSQTKEFVESK